MLDALLNNLLTLDIIYLLALCSAMFSYHVEYISDLSAMISLYSIQVRAILTEHETDRITQRLSPALISIATH